MQKENEVEENLSLFACSSRRQMIDGIQQALPIGTGTRKYQKIDVQCVRCYFDVQ